MFDIPSFRIGRVFGIPVEVNVSWLAIFALVAFSLATTYFPNAVATAEQSIAPVARWQFYVVGTLTALLFFASILAHELSHSLVVRASGGHVDKITLFIFGGVAQMEDEPTTPGREFLMAAAGPAMSIVLGAIALVGSSVAAASGAEWWVWAPLEYLGFINVFVGAFNLLPGFPLDGGRVLRSILWGITHDVLKATRWAVRSGQFIGWSMVVLAVATALQGSTDFIWFGLIGWFIASLASQAYRQQEVRSKLSGVTVGQLMTRQPEYVDGTLTLDALVRDHFIGGRHSRYPVLYEGSIVGLVTLPDAKRISQADWPFVRTIEVTNRELSTLVVRAEETALSVLPRLAGDRPGALIVVEAGLLAGVVTRADVIALLEEGARG